MTEDHELSIQNVSKSMSILLTAIRRLGFFPAK